jgi:F5/8 type C domain-containing protein/alpha-galactosidase-like protein
MTGSKTRRLAGLAIVIAFLLSGLQPATAQVQHEPPPATGVVPITWRDFDRDLPRDAQSERVRRIMLNANKYALTTWFPAKYGSQTGDYLDLGGTAEPNVRPPGSEALALATSLATGAYDPAVAGFSREQAERVAEKLVTSIAYRHKTNSAGGWGEHWQSALWAFNAAFAGWLLWDDLDATDREYVRRMVVAEADRFLDYPVPYYADPDGTVNTPGDSKAEENAWNAAFVNLAVSMLPRHPNRAVWQDKALELMISSYSRPSDQLRETVVNGKELSSWLHGSNIFEDGTLVNHSRIHPDYFTSIANISGAPLAYGLAGLPTPKAAFFNADLVYDALADHQFAAPPYAAPGGTIYLRDAQGKATSAIYYPQSNDWGTSRQLHFLMLDTLADVFDLDHRSALPARDWAAAHATRALEMQARFTDGRTYGAGSEDTYAGREEWVALLAGRSYLTHWLDHNARLTVTNRAYPVTPADRPGATVTLNAPASFPQGRATPVTLTLRSTSEEPLTRLRSRLDLPQGWTAVPSGQPATTVPPGGQVTQTWQVTPDPNGTEESVTVDASASYKVYGRDRTLEARAFAAVAPGVNLALGKQVTVSSARSGSGGDKVVDGLFTDASRWLSADDDPAPSLTIDLGAPTDLSAVYIYSGYTRTNNDPTTTLKDFTVEVRTADGTWQRIADVADNDEYRVTLRNLDVRGDQVRLLITDPSGSTIDITRVFEVEVYA